MRHPSEITKDELIVIAKIINQRSFDNPKIWRMEPSNDTSLPECYKLVSRSSSHVFWWHWNEFEISGVDISFDDGVRDNYPTFFESIKIKDYLEHIEIGHMPLVIL